jgi:DNA-binding beta-propeller fold protein YncE
MVSFHSWQERGFGGDGGPATQASLATPTDVAVDRFGNIFITDTDNHRIRRIDTNGTITTFAGTGISDKKDRNDLALEVGLFLPQRIAIDKRGNLFFTDGDFNAPRIRRITPTSKLVETVFTPENLRLTAGTESDGDPMVPEYLVVDRNDNVLFTGDQDHVFRIREDRKSLEVFAGAKKGFVGDGELATKTRFGWLRGIAVDDRGNLYIADSDKHTVRRIDAKTKIVTTVAGNGGSEMGTVARVRFRCEVCEIGRWLVPETDTNRTKGLLPLHLSGL